MSANHINFELLEYFKKGFEPDYGPLFGALEKLAEALSKKPEGKIPLVIFESI